MGNQTYFTSQWGVGGKSNVFHFPVGGGWEIKCIQFPSGGGGGGGWETTCIPFPSEAVGLGVLHFVETGMQMLTILH